MKWRLFILLVMISTGYLKSFLPVSHTPKAAVFYADSGETSESDFGPEETDFC